MNLIDYFGRIRIIHLPGRVDRLRALEAELGRIGVRLNDPRIAIPPAPMPESLDGMPSKAVYGNFLSHLNILKEALRDECRAVWVLEDDAIFRKRFVNEQARVAAYLGSHEWDFCYLGYAGASDLSGEPQGCIRYDGGLYWAHCYAINHRILPRLIEYLELTLHTPEGHPDGGKMYIDGAYGMFRQRNADVITIVSNPVLSVQRGSRSSIAGCRWYDRGSVSASLIAFARAVRDESWRQIGWPKTKQMRPQPAKC